MALNNDQFNRILREYDKRQQENHYQLQQRQEEIYARIPAIQQLEAELATNAVAATKSTLMGDTTALDQLKKNNAELIEAKQALLISHGYPADYLSMSYTCPDCKDTGYITDAQWQDEDHVLLSNNKCHCMKQAIVSMLYQQSNIQVALEKENFSTFSYDYYDKTFIHATTGMSAYDNVKEIVNTCHAFIQNFDSNFENILIYGESGSGKTFLSNCVAKELLDTFHTVIYLTAFELFSIFEKHTFAKKGEDNAEEQFQGILDCDLLIIDDLGTELTNTFTNSQLYNCINERMLNQRSTLISTNLNLEQLKALYGDRIFSRLVGNYIMCNLFGNDIRFKKQLQ